MRSLSCHSLKRCVLCTGILNEEFVIAHPVTGAIQRALPHLRFLVCLAACVQNEGFKTIDGPK